MRAMAAPRSRRRLAVAIVAAVGATTPLAPSAAATAPGVAGITPSTGIYHGGTSVTITGTGFTGVTGVRFGLVTAPWFHLDTDTDGTDTITAFTPAQPAPGPVPVTVLVGETASSGSAVFTYFDGGWAAGAPMAVVRRGQGATLLKDSSVLVDTCENCNSRSGNFAAEVYGPLSPGGPVGWRPSGTPAARRGEHTSTQLEDGKVLVAGGRQSQVQLGSAEVYDPQTVAWASAGTMVTARRSHGAVRLDGPPCRVAPAPDYCGKVLVVGGETDTSYSATGSSELYDPSSRPPTWTATRGSLETARSGHTITLLDDGKVLVAGGRGASNSPLASSEIYDPATELWSPTPTGLRDARVNARAVPLGGGRVLVVGGLAVRGGSVALGSAEIYDSTKGEWATTGSMALPRQGHSATLLPGGRVVVVGGQKVATDAEPGSGGLASVEVWDPKTGEWAPTMPLSAGRTDHSTTLLSDGTVLVTGGGGRLGLFQQASLLEPLSSSEIFDPAFRPVPTVTKVTPASGPPAGGTEVHINGTYLFGAPMTVRFGTAEAAATPVSEREIVATAPAGLGAVDVTVTTVHGTSQRSGASQYRYLPGGWTDASSLDTCGPATACGGRASQEAIALNPPACTSGTAPPSYPCGKLFLAGQRARTFRDGQVRRGETFVTSASAPFTEADVGRGISSPVTSDPFVPGGSFISEFISPTKVKVAMGNAGGDATVTFTIWDSSAQLYDPVTGAWSATRPMNAHRATVPWVPEATFTTTLLPDGRVLAAGGCCDPARFGSKRALSSSEIYDPATDTWTPTMGSMIEGRVGHTATVLTGPSCTRAPAPLSCGKVLVAGGLEYLNDGNTPRLIRQSAELYDPRTDTWSKTGDLVEARVLPSATPLANGDVLVVGGTGIGINGPLYPDEIPLASAEVYHPSDGMWSSIAAAPDAKVLHSATTLDPPFCRTGPPRPGYPCGKVLVVGGARDFNAGAYLATDGKVSVALYDPVGSTWAPAGATNLGRGAHTATLLPDGTILLAGGFGAGATVEVYDPVTTTSRLLASMSAARATQTATLIDGGPCGVRCGQVLVAGGIDSPESSPFGALASAELYTPAPWAGGATPGTGPSRGGTSVEITGAALGQVDGVSFGTTTVTTHPCPPVAPAAGCFTVESPARITAVAPAHPAGTVELTPTSPLWPAGSSVTGRGARFTFVASDLPAAVSDLKAQALSTTEINLTFSAVPSDGNRPPPAARYAIRQALSPITDEAGFAAATLLCPQACVFTPPAVGASLTLAVSNLKPGRTYHYAVKALDAAGGTGPISNPATATTSGPPPSCPDLAAAGPGQVAYPAGYSLIGLPAGTTPAASGQYYGWFDQPAKGRYSGRDADVGVEAGHGYWAWSPCPRLVDLARPGHDELSLALGAYHTSIVANPSVNGPVTVSGYDYAARWDPTLANGAGGYRYSERRQPLTLALGEAMWVFSASDTIITIRR